MRGNDIYSKYGILNLLLTVLKNTNIKNLLIHPTPPLSSIAGPHQICLSSPMPPHHRKLPIDTPHLITTSTAAYSFVRSGSILSSYHS